MASNLWLYLSQFLNPGLPGESQQVWILWCLCLSKKSTAHLKERQNTVFLILQSYYPYASVIWSKLWEMWLKLLLLTVWTVINSQGTACTLVRNGKYVSSLKAMKKRSCSWTINRRQVQFWETSNKATSQLLQLNLDLGYLCLYTLLLWSH